MGPVIILVPWVLAVAGLFLWLLWVRRERRYCYHVTAFVSEWTASDGTPMVTVFCPQCGWRDQGPVHGG